MTEDEAEKILDFLCRRFKGVSSWDGFSFTVKQNCFLKVELNRICVECLYDDYSKMHVNNSYIWRFPGKVLKTFHCDARICTLETEDEFTMKNVIELLLKEAKTNNIFIQNSIFIFKGETPEELLVKADLEDFN